jgi:hypothetical protein
MAFCNSCGATVEPAGKFCPKCGAGVPATAATPSVSHAPAAPAQSSSAVKIVLIVAGVLVLLFVIGAGVTGIIAWRIARSTHVRQRNGNVKVETPFGTVESTDNAEDAARNLGIDLYPGARVLKGNAANLNFGGMHTVAAEFETDDPPEKVAEFYKSRLPAANVSVSDEKHYAIVSTANKNIVTVNIEAEDGKTRIHIANVSGKGAGDSGSSD